MNKIPRILRIVLSLLVFAALAWGFAIGVRDANAGGFANLCQLQLGPALLRVVADFALVPLIIVLAILALTFLFGRFYCAFFCPLGILQDFIGWLAPGKSKPVKNFRALRWGIALAAFAFLAMGCAVAFKYLDPFSNFGRVAVATLTPAAHLARESLKKHFPLWYLDTHATEGLIVWWGVATLLVLVGLVVWKRRIFCTALCPVGTLLGFFSARGLFKLKLNCSCACKRCVNVCPAGCIDPASGIDNERCLRCMNCVAACPAKRIVFTAKREPIAVNPSRRDFFGWAAVAGYAAFGAVIVQKIVSANTFKIHKCPGNHGCRACAKSIVPPGAGSPERFASLCTVCGLCVVNCKGGKGGAIQPPTAKIPHPHLNFDKGYCEYNCCICSQVCPTGALRKMSLEEKQHCRVGMAEFDESICVAVIDGTHCGACAEHCPTTALQMVDLGSGIPVPVLNESLCIGCGACEYPCPTEPKAIVIKPVRVQVQAATPVHEPPPPPPKTDEWLI